MVLIKVAKEVTSTFMERFVLTTSLSGTSVQEPGGQTGKQQARKEKSSTPKGEKASHSLPLLESTISHTLALVHLGGITSGLEGVAGGGEGLEVCAVLLVGLKYHRISTLQRYNSTVK